MVINRTGSHYGAGAGVVRALILAVLFLAGCAGIPQGQSIPAKVTEWATTNVWQVHTDRSAGSGFWINDRNMVTNCHVVRGQTTVTVENNTRSMVLPMTVRACNGDEDLALLVYTPDGPVPFEPMDTEIAQAKRGQVLYGPGYPLGGSLVTTTGHYQGRDVRYSHRTVVTTTTIFGDSGSPAVYLDRWGDIVVAGVRSGIRGMRTGFSSYFVTHLVTIRDANTVKKFLRDNA